MEMDAATGVEQHLLHVGKTLLLKQLTAAEQVHGKLYRNHAVGLTALLQVLVAVPFVVQIGAQNHQIIVRIPLNGIAHDPCARHACHEVDFKLRMVVDGVIEAVANGIEHHEYIRG